MNSHGGHRHWPSSRSWRLLATSAAAVLLTSITFTSTLATAHVPRVSTQIHAPFNAPPVQFELLELAAGSNDCAYFAIVDTLFASGHLGSSAQPSNDNGTVGSLISNLIKGGHVKDDGMESTLLRLSLSVHKSAAAIQAHYHHYDNVAIPRLVNASQAEPACASWAIVGSNKHDAMICNAEQLADALNALQLSHPANVDTLSSDLLLPFDRVLNRDHCGTRPVVLYADMLSSSFESMHRTIMSFANSETNPICYIIRYAPSRLSNPAPLELSGYGAALLLKSVEYKTIDDRNLSALGSLGSEDQILFASTMKSVGGDKDEYVFPLDLLVPPNGEHSIKAISKDQMSTIGIATAWFILQQPEPLKAWRILVQDFPKYAHHLAGLFEGSPQQASATNAATNDAAIYVDSGIPEGVYINGLLLDNGSDLQPLSLVDILRSEYSMIESLTSGSQIGLTPESALKLIMSESIANSIQSASQASHQATFDIRDHSANKHTVVWFNDIENDYAYSGFSKRLSDLFQPAFPGQMRLLRKNLMSVLFALDLSDRISLEYIYKDVAMNLKRRVPLRFGLVPVLNLSEPASATNVMARLFYYATHAYGSQIVPDLFEIIGGALEDNPNTNILDAAKDALGQLSSSRRIKSGATKLDWNDIVDSSSSTWLDAIMSDATAYNKRLAISKSAHSSQSIGGVFANGRFIDLGEGFRGAVMQHYKAAISMLQQAVYDSEIDDNASVFEYLMTRPDVSPRRCPLVYPSERNPLQFVNLVNTFGTEKLDSLQYVYGSAEAKKKNKKNANSKDVDPVAQVSIMAIMDVNTESGRKLAATVLHALAARDGANPDSLDTTIRATLIHRPNFSTIKKETHDDKSSSELVYTALYSGAAKSVPSRTLASYLASQLDSNAEFVSDNSEWTAESISALVHGANVTSGDADAFWHRFATVDIPGIGQESLLLINGRIIRLPSSSSSSSSSSDSSSLSSEDLLALASFENKVRVAPIVNALHDDAKFSPSSAKLCQSEILMRTVSILGHLFEPTKYDIMSEDTSGSQYILRRNIRTDFVSIQNSFSLKSEKSTMLQVDVVVDPASKPAQKLSAILENIAILPSVDMRVYLRPSLNVTSLPVEQMYRFVWPILSSATPLSTTLASELDTRRSVPMAVFDDLPAGQLFTLDMDTHPAWFITPVESIHDLDNIKLESDGSSGSVHSVYELKHILLEGHCLDKVAGSPPRGMQLELTVPGHDAAVFDTLVMANLGYFQLRANPGAWRLAIRKGRSADLYKLESLGLNGWYDNIKPSTAEDLSIDVAITGLDGTVVYLQVAKRRGRESDDVLEDPSNAALAPSDAGESRPVWDTIRSHVHEVIRRTGIISADISDSERTVINIFSVASGHLYERFLGIMILSVLRHTRSKVKFWFIENFLSPQFKHFLPFMAKTRGFEYELVTYKWPRWLRAQTEKQRTIWGYKILFLDVMFPLSLDRIVFVDADQIVRSDLQELVNMDLHGAPYGYTPFCDDRSEIEPYRFWKTGYWHNFLRGKPYHISALYVVDLKRFRQLAAGDLLRQHYHGLSADKNSLANLDQDLPNHMQHNLPIHSLPQEWLWCSTWCSMKSLKKAKTIDLCNDPMTREPKLSRARRLIPEWNDYDQEVAALFEEAAAQESHQQPVIAEAIVDDASTVTATSETHDEL
ncbi:hypothetical protein GQ42DRAFT_164697 [Ramicandelaber brevisporus]|nr:hypothetical protein GQ42DRAFT_164697 [Ramicandelaber brevisporus]